MLVRTTDYRDTKTNPLCSGGDLSPHQFEGADGIVPRPQVPEPGAKEFHPRKDRAKDRIVAKDQREGLRVDAWKKLRSRTSRSTKPGKASSAIELRSGQVVDETMSVMSQPVPP